MTSGDQANEVLGIVKRIGPVVLSSTFDMSGDAGTSLRRAVGMLIVDRNMANIQTFCFAFNVCIDLARHCGATLVSMDRVRKAALAEKPVSLPAVQTVHAIVRLVLAMESRVIGYMTFRSREEVDQIATAMNKAFSETSEFAADDLDAGLYMAIVALHGAVTLHLSDRGRQLPRIIGYSTQVPMPSLRLAQRTYADPRRHVELINENNVVHPAFMPREGKMLAV